MIEIFFETTNVQQIQTTTQGKDYFNKYFGL